MLAHLSNATAAPVLRKRIEESFRTRRLTRSIENAPHQQRSAIIKAVSRPEMSPPGARADGSRPADRDRASPGQPADHQEADGD
jgi:hypothetical protein